MSPLKKDWAAEFLLIQIPHVFRLLPQVTTFPKTHSSHLPGGIYRPFMDLMGNAVNCSVPLQL